MLKLPNMLKENPPKPCCQRPGPTLKRLVGTADGRWRKSLSAMCNCRLWLRSINEPGVQLSARSKAHKVQLQARGMACVLLAGASKALGSTVESSPVPRRLSSSLSPNQAAGSYFGDGRDAPCAVALPISATCTPVAHPAAPQRP